MTPFAKLVTLALVCYLSFVVYRAINKLESRDLGTMFSTKSEETVQGGYSIHHISKVGYTKNRIDSGFVKFRVILP